MLERARRKAPGLRFEWGDALRLPYADDEFDAATVGFGARNFSDLEQGLREMTRVVRPGGQVVVLEITTPTRPPLSTFFALWFDRVVPLHRRRCDDAYTYLPNSVQALPGPAAARRRPGGGGPDRRPLGADRRRHHRPAPRTRGGLMASAESVLAVIEAAGAHVPGADGPPRGPPGRAGDGPRRPCWPSTPAPRSPPAASGCGRCSCCWRPGRRRTRDAEEGLLRAAAAVELVHSATLVHDDVLDAAPLRRGRPTVFATAGRGMATATGDLLFAQAFAELARNGRAEEVRVLSAASSALARGELLQRADAWNADVSPERYLAALRPQDGAAVRGGVRARRAGGRRARGASSGAFGRRIGLAFQLLDDVLDVSGPAERTGKHRGTDLLDGTVTLPLIVARERDSELARVDLRAITTPEQAEALCDRITATGALDVARAQALDMVAEAKGALPESPEGQRGALELVADGVVDRYA